MLETKRNNITINIINMKNRKWSTYPTKVELKNLLSIEEEDIEKTLKWKTKKCNIKYFDVSQSIITERMFFNFPN
jgi:hypothetical protein